MYLKNLVPTRLKSSLEQLKISTKRIKKRIKRKIGYFAPNPNLEYVELHLTDHCNFSCARCSHFSPIASKWFADPEIHEDDMRQLAKLFLNINIIRLMGGEPLLHSEVTSFLSSTRNCFPRSDIHLVTNGLLLDKKDKHFWNCCRDNSITISVTKYPPLKKRAEDIYHLAKDNKVNVIVANVTNFRSRRNFNGDSDPTKAFKICAREMYCPFLREGKLYICALPAVAHYSNKNFGTTIPHTGYIDIYSPGLTGKDILRFLDQPSDVCRFCSYEYPQFKWSVSSKKKQEWDPSCNI